MRALQRLTMPSGRFCLALLLLVAVHPAVNSAALPSDSDADEGLRRLTKRQVVNINHPSRDSIRNMGLDPYEERLLIIVLGSCIAFVFALVAVVICCRTYSIDRKAIEKDSGGGAGSWGLQPMLQTGQMMAYPGQMAPGGSRQAYYPTGYQPSVQMDPAYLDPTKAGGLSVVGQQQRQPQRQPMHQMMVDNNVYG